MGAHSTRRGVAVLLFVALATVIWQRVGIGVIAPVAGEAIKAFTPIQRSQVVMQRFRFYIGKPLRPDAIAGRLTLVDLPRGSLFDPAQLTPLAPDASAPLEVLAIPAAAGAPPRAVGRRVGLRARPATTADKSSPERILSGCVIAQVGNTVLVAVPAGSVSAGEVAEISDVRLVPQPECGRL